MSSIRTSNRVSAKGGSNAERACYLATLFSGATRGSFVELRFRVSDGMRRDFFPVADLDAVEKTIARLGPRTDVYVGVLARARRGGTRGDIVDAGAVLWADCDTTQSVAMLADFSPAPTMIVASGSGSNCHAYWLLKDCVSLDVIERANRQLAELLGSDTSCVDAARILRPPSLNHKHAPARPVRLIGCDPARRYGVDDVVGCSEPARILAPYRHPALRDVHADPLLAVSPQRYVAQLTGLEVPRGRKVSCPFHDDRTPSLHVYRDPAHGWYCFGCRRGGSAYDFAAALWGYTTRGGDFLALRERLTATLDL